MADSTKAPAREEDRHLSALQEVQASLTLKVEELTREFRRFSTEMRRDLQTYKSRERGYPLEQTTIYVQCSEDDRRGDSDCTNRRRLNRETTRGKEAWYLSNNLDFKED